jgi:hypothetical protein
MSTRARSCGAHGEARWTGRLVPLTVDGLICASSMVMLDSARRKVPVPALARWLLGLGVAFLQSVPSVLSCTLARPGRSGSEGTSRDLRNGLRIQLRERLAGRADTLAAEARGATCVGASNRLMRLRMAQYRAVARARIRILCAISFLLSFAWRLSAERIAQLSE